VLLLFTLVINVVVGKNLMIYASKIIAFSAL